MDIKDKVIELDVDFEPDCEFIGLVNNPFQLTEDESKFMDKKDIDLKDVN